MITDLINRLHSTRQAVDQNTATCCILDVSHSPRTIESTSRRGKKAKVLSKGVLAAVVKDDDARAARSEQLGQGLTTRPCQRTVASGDRGVCATRACCKTGQAREE